MTFTPEVWDGVLRRLQDEVPSFSYEAWLEPLEACADERGLVLVCPSTFHRERIRDHYLPRIDACLREELGLKKEHEAEPGIEETGDDLTIELGVRARRADPTKRSTTTGPCRSERGLAKPREARRATRDLPPRPGRRSATQSREEGRPDERQDERGETDERDESVGHTNAVPITAQTNAGSTKTGAPAQGPGGATPNPVAATTATTATMGSDAYTFDTFVVGPCNALAREAALAMARDQQRTLAQLYICAGPGMGKTHLSRAVAAEANRVGVNTVQYVAAETFTNQFLASLRSNRTGEFKRRYRGRRQLLVVEDVQFLERKEATQLEFFHTVAHVLDTGGRVVVTGDRMPGEMRQLDDRLRSQLMGGFLAELERPDAQVRRAIFRAKAAHGGWRLPQECLDALVDSVAGSIRDLESVLIQLVTTAALLNQPIDLDLTHSAIAKKSPARISAPARRTLGDVIGTVAAFFQTTPERLAARSRKQQILIPRQIAMYLAHRYTDATTAEIARSLGRDHPAVRNAIAKIERAILEKPKLRYQIEAVVERLEG